VSRGHHIIWRNSRPAAECVEARASRRDGSRLFLCCLFEPRLASRCSGESDAGPFSSGDCQTKAKKNMQSIRPTLRAS
jgi:hypothetical protein